MDSSKIGMREIEERRNSDLKTKKIQKFELRFGSEVREGTTETTRNSITKVPNVAAKYLEQAKIPESRRAKIEARAG